MNTCDGCTLCCKVLGVTELDKPDGVWCVHAQKGRGCAIYADRPQTCRNFACEWLTSGLDAEARPDRIHGVLIGSDDQRFLTLHEDAGWPGYATVALAPLFKRLANDNVTVMVMRGAR